MQEQLTAIERRLELLETPLTNETLLFCIQCGKNYLEKRNPQGICHFHITEVGDSWSRTPGKYSCCGSSSGSDGCQRKSHKSVHHFEYPYNNYQKWFRTTLQGIDLVWIEIERPDYIHNSTVKAEIGILSDETTIFLRTGSKLQLFENLTIPNQFSLSDIGKVDSYSKIVIETPTTWSVPLIVSKLQKHQGGGEDGNKQQQHVITVTVKSSSDTEPERVKFSLSSDSINGKILPNSMKILEKTELKSKKKSKETLELKVSDTFTGSTLFLEEPPVLKKYVQEGTANNLTVKFGSLPLQVGSDYSESGGFFKQYVTGNLSILNPNTTPVLISEISSEYENGEKIWVRSVDAIPSSNRGITIEGCKAIELEVTCVIQVKGKPGNDNKARRRIHASLPQPLRVRFIVGFVDSQNISIVGECCNSKLEVRSKTEWEESWSAKFLHYAECDDVSVPARHIVAVYMNESKNLVIRNSINSSTYYTFSKSEMERLTYRASVAGESIRSLDDLKYKNSEEGTEFSAYLIFKDELPYQFKFDIQTSCSRLETYFNLPNDDENECILSIDSSISQPFRRDQLLKINWSCSIPSFIVPEGDWIGIFKEFSSKSSSNNIGEYIKLEKRAEGSGEIRLPLVSGNYEVRWISDNTCVAKTQVIQV